MTNQVLYKYLVFDVVLAYSEEDLRNFLVKKQLKLAGR